jgi:HEAT repeat protein
MAQPSGRVPRGWILYAKVITVAASSLDRLIQLRSRLTKVVLDYLDEVVARASELPAYFPTHLRNAAEGENGFEAIQQQVQLIEDRSRWDQWTAEGRERLRAAGFDDRVAYNPNRARPEGDDSDDRRDGPAPAPLLPWDEHAAEKFRRAVILGDPGMGKSWLLRIEARRLAIAGKERIEARKRSLAETSVPIFARLPDLNQSDGPLEEALIAQAGMGRSDIFRNWLHDQLTSGGAVVLLDAWDEVPVERPEPGQPLVYRSHHQQRLGQRIDEFARNFPRCRLLMTSRVVGFVGSPFPGVQELELTAFDRPQIHRFARAWFGKERAAPFLGMLEANLPMRGLARIPLILTLMCRAFLEQKLNFPSRRVDLYGRCVWGLLRDWKEEKERREIAETEVEMQLGLLADAAVVLFEEGREQFRERDLVRVLIRVESEKERAQLVEGWKRDGLLVRTGQDRDASYLFLHRTFHEYLAALGLARRGWPAIERQIDRKAWLPAWQEAIVMVARLLDDPAPLLRMLADEQHDDLFRHRLILSVRALSEVRESDRPDGLAEQIVHGTIQLWQRHAEADTLWKFEHLNRALATVATLNRPIEAPLLDGLVNLLTSRNGSASTRFWVVQGLQDLGSTASNAVPALTKLLDHEDWKVRRTAATALGRIGPMAASAIPRLVQMVRDEHEVVRDKKDYFQLLDENDDPRDAAAKGLGRIGAAAVGHLISLLGDENGDVRGAAAEALGESDEHAATTVPELMQVLHDKNWEVQSKAAAALGSIGPPAAAAVSDLIQILQEAGSSGAVGKRLVGDTILTRGRDYGLMDWGALELLRTVAWALGRIGSAASAATPALLELQTDSRDDALSRGVAEALAAIDPAADASSILIPGSGAIRGLEYDSTPIFSPLALSPITTHGWSGIHELEPLPIVTPNMVLHYIQDLHGEDLGHRYWAAETLGKLGPAAAPAVPDLIKLIRAAARTLPDKKSLGVSVWTVGYRAAKSLGEIGLAPRTAVPDLIQLLRDGEVWVRRAVARLLGGTGSAAAPAVRSLIDALCDGDAGVRSEAARALGELGSTAASGVPNLIEALRDIDAAVRREAVNALRQLGPLAAPAVPDLIEHLREADHDVRASATEALGAIGPAAAPAVPELVQLMGQTEHEMLRSAAASALARMMAGGMRVFPDGLTNFRVQLLEELGANPDHRRD